MFLRKLKLIFAVTVLVIILITGGYLLREGEKLITDNVGTEVGQIAPDFTLTDVFGETFNLSDFRGRVVVIDFMATWCAPCVLQMGHLKQIYNNYREVVIISIGIDPNETDEVLREFKKEYGDGWIFAKGPSVGVAYKVLYIPTIYIIDQEGRIAYKNTGLATYSSLSAEINKLLGR